MAKQHMVTVVERDLAQLRNERNELRAEFERLKLEKHDLELQVTNIAYDIDRRQQVADKYRAEVERLNAQHEQLLGAYDHQRAEVERLNGLLETERLVARMIGDAHKKDAAEVERLRAELARWKPSCCGKIYPVPVPGEVVKNCTRPIDHEGPHQTENVLIDLRKAAVANRALAKPKEEIPQ
jgi:predicted RNase H-like nuclease (RuvC/YqgF family)